MEVHNIFLYILKNVKNFSSQSQ